MIKCQMMKNDLILLSGADIPFVEGTVTIHQPTIYEISLVGEECLFTGCELLQFSKDLLSIEDKSRLENLTDFNILMSIINDKSGSMKNQISCAQQVLDLLFPLYMIEITQETIELRDRQTYSLCGQIDDKNFLAFKNIIQQIFCLKKPEIQEYNVQGELAKRIAEKFKKRKQQLAALQSSQNRIAIFSRYISILAVGEHKDINSFMNYTVYQLFDEFQRFQLKMSYDIYFEAKMAGAKDLKDPEDWMKDLHGEN